MKMEYVISSWDVPSLPIVGSNARFPVRRIFCVGRNYVEHQKEMGGDGREQPFFFAKSAHDLVPEGGAVRYPPMTSSYHWETEMVAVIGTGGYKIPATKANEHIWGYAVGLDMTRRDLRSEEHTSELQSRLHLVCRLLLEKKKQICRLQVHD